MKGKQGNNVSLNPYVMIVDDDESVLDSLSSFLCSENWQVICARSGFEALRNLERHNIKIVLTDIVMPGLDGISLLNKIKKSDSDIEVIIITGNSSEKKAINALKAGAFDYLMKPVKGTEIMSSLFRTKYFSDNRFKNFDLHPARQTCANQNEYTFIGDSISSLLMLKKFEKIAAVGPNATVLIYGETGVGKEIAARTLHRLTKNKDASFEAINCGGISESLLERELFGHEKGAFTGADKRSQGVFEMAIGGSVLLDEITEMNLYGQSRFLRVLESRSFKRIGGCSEVYLDNTRIIATTNKDMKQLVEDGKFREDLFYRLNVIPVYISPLRERRDDILLLANHFLRDMVKDHSVTFSKEVCDKLYSYDYPGNIRELKNIIQYVAVFRSGDVIQTSDLMLPELCTNRSSANKITPDNRSSQSDLNLENNEINLINRAISFSPNNLSSVAKNLGISPQALYRRLKKYKISGIEVSNQDEYHNIRT